METNQSNLTGNQQQRDEKLWKLAKKRSEFKKHALTYLIINLFLWGLWLFGGIKRGDYNFPWPAFVTLGWGIGLAFNYIGAYSAFGESLREKEYQKLINKQN